MILAETLYIIHFITNHKRYILFNINIIPCIVLLKTKYQLLQLFKRMKKNITKTIEMLR